MKTLDWNTLFGERARRIQASTIRELLKLTQRPGVLSFAGGLPAPELFPKEEAAAKAAEILREKGEVALQYGPTEGYFPLRAWVAGWLGVSPEEVLITTGSQQALDLLGKVFLDEASPVLLEAPSYMGAIQAFRAYGPRFLTVPAGEEGPDLKALEEALDQERPRFLYLIPSFQNPSGGLMPLEARRRLLEMAMERGLVVVEDDAYRELYFGESRLPSLFELAREAGYPGVIYLSSFSKVLAPGLRVAFVVARPEVILKLTQAKQGVDLHTPVLNQILVHELVKEGFPERLERIRTTYKAKAQAMLEALDREMPKEVAYTRPKGGMFVWMTLPEGLSAEALFRQALEENVAFVPGGPFFANGGGENTLRLSYATMDPERIQEGIRRLGKAVKGLLATA
ncbi:2-aminoadipate transaminase [Thermus antranikianii]|uniref:Aminotransferase class I/II-fold pyridoxal phosphate-dependent enzyme n=1 Tax=Thermus antranikianii TaxID=88190 RepID=A0ABY7RR80_9DEIN|nr:2-aminoadipate transaminase [Thermus antranikianii]WCM40191.1 aminotransferase class I/II-fold pyridoxal phosphate-dependent enzyme [Thermus antranikianii]